VAENVSVSRTPSLQRQPTHAALNDAALRTLMLVSADAGLQMRSEVSAGRRPCPEFMRLEQRFGVEILDWSRVGLEGRARSVRGSITHVARSVSMLKGYDAVFSDGEHVGIPLALAMYASGLRKPHLMIAHNPTGRVKRRIFRLRPVQTHIDRIVLHSESQLSSVPAALRVPQPKLRLTAYGIDTDFWRPQAVSLRPLLVAPGREHRDHLTLALACQGLAQEVFVSGASAHSPRAAVTRPQSWPANFHWGSVDYLALRRLYAEAVAVVVPLLASDSPAGITTVLEAMAVGKAVVASDTAGLHGVIEDGVTGLLVPPGDAAALRAAILRLIGEPEERARLGANARLVAEQRYGLDMYAGALAGHIEDLVRESRSAGARH
jgi:glycosyltransferase involved in cell wall biosynthesis